MIAPASVAAKLLPLAAALPLVLWSAGCDQADATKAPPPPAPVVTAEDVTGSWEIDSNSYREVAFNMALVQLERKGMEFTDEEIERALEPLIDVVRADPPAYTLNADGTLTARGGKTTVAGNWTIENGLIVVTSPTIEGKRRFRYEDGYLINLPGSSRGREIVLVRK